MFNQTCTVNINVKHICQDFSDVYIYIIFFPKKVFIIVLIVHIWDVIIEARAHSGIIKPDFTTTPVFDESAGGVRVSRSI